MGLSTLACTVPYSLEGVNEIVDPVFSEYDPCVVENNLDHNGWNFGFDKTYQFKAQSKSLYTNVIKKGKIKIFVINQSPYESGGAYDWAIFAKNKNEIEIFLKDFKSAHKIKNIKQNIALQQTL